jgi:hypothetical protein
MNTNKKDKNNIKVFSPMPIKTNPIDDLFGKILFGVAKNECKKENEEAEESEELEQQDYLEDLEKNRKD